MVYRLNETTWLQDAGGGAEIFYFQNWAMLTIVLNLFVFMQPRFQEKLVAARASLATRVSSSKVLHLEIEKTPGESIPVRSWS